MASLVEPTIAEAAVAAPPQPRFRIGLGWAAGLVLPLLLGIAWEVAAGQGWINARLLPPPSRIGATAWKLAAGGDLALHVLATSERVLLGFLAGALAATVVGALTGQVALVRRLLDPSIQALRAIPSIAWVPLFILWFGIFETSKVVLIAVGTFFPVYLGLSQAILGTDRKLVEVGRSFRLSGFGLVRRVLIPAALPSYLVALRSGLGLGWMFVVAAEFMGASEGLGFLLTDGQMTGKPDTIMVAILAFAFAGKATDFLLALLARRLLRWQDVVTP